MNVISEEQVGHFCRQPTSAGSVDFVKRGKIDALLADLRDLTMEIGDVLA